MNSIEQKLQIAEHERLFLQEWANSAFDSKRIWPPIDEASSYLSCDKSGARLYGWENMIELNEKLKDVCKDLPEGDNLAKVCTVAAYKLHNNKITSNDSKETIVDGNSQSVPDFIYVF